MSPGDCKRGRDGGKFKRKLSEVNTRAVSRGQNELIGEFKMAGGDLISVRGWVMEDTNSLFIPVGMYIYSITCPLILITLPAATLNFLSIRSVLKTQPLY